AMSGASSVPTAPGAPPQPAVIDFVSIADQLEQRRQSLGTDLVILLDDQGRVVARTDQPTVNASVRDDLYEQSPIVKKIVDDASVEWNAGVLPLGTRRYHAAVAPIGAGATKVRVCVIGCAFGIDGPVA